MANFAPLLKNQKYYLETLNKINEKISSTPDANASIYYNDVKQLFEKFSNVQEQINALELTLVDQQQVDSIKTEFSDLYFELIAKCTPKTDISSNPRSSNLMNPSNALKLPKFQVPSFSGDIKQYENFIALYNVMIHDAQMPEIQKFQYLRSALSGDPLSLISNLPITKENYQIAYEAITTRYSNKRRLATFHFNQLSSFKPASQPSFETHQRFLSVHNNAIRALKQMQIDLTDFLLLSLSLDNLDNATRAAFEEKLSADDIPDSTQLLNFVTDRLRAAEALESRQISTMPINPVTQVKPRNKFRTEHSFPQNTLITKSSSSNPSEFHSNNRPSTSSNTYYAERPVNKCFYCHSESHIIANCTRFLALNIDDRTKAIYDANRCNNCFGHHHITQCRSTQGCKICKSRYHHSLLHRFTRSSYPAEIKQNFPPRSDQDPDNSDHGSQSPHPSTSYTFAESSSTNKSQTSSPHNKSPNSSNNSAKKQTASLLNNSSSDTKVHDVLLGTALVLINDLHGYPTIIRAVIDSGSQSTIITSRAVKKLNLKITPSTNELIGIASSKSIVKGLTQLTVSSKLSQIWQMQCHALVVSQIIGDLPANSIHKHSARQFDHLTLADPKFYKSSPIDLLLGADVFPELISQQPSMLKGNPTALNTVFGWIIIGKIPIMNQPSISTSLLCTNDALNSSLQQFWTIEEISSPKPINPDEQLCENLFKTTTSRNEKGKYIVALPFKTNSVSLLSTREPVMRNYLKFENRLKSKPETLAKYHEFMREYINLGHMSVASSPSLYVIPHHCVFKEASSTTKIRTVFNASYPDSAGNSLNNQLLPGPKLQRDLSNILTSFRLTNFVICADIKMMYRQILIRPEDRKHQHIFYRPEENSPVLEYELNTVTYGVVPSAFHAQRALQQLVLDHGKNYPLAAQAILHQSYVDDILSGADTLADTRKLISQLNQLMSLAGFELRKWKSNHPSLLSDFSHDLLENPIAFSDDSINTKILGLHWNPSNDSFSYYVTCFEGPYTKRNILSYISRIFDPQGFLAPVILWAKCFIKQLWISNLSWDEEIPTDLINHWKLLTTELPVLTDLHIPRFVGNSIAKYRILGFCDASEKGYAAVIYLHVSLNDQHNIHLIKSKSRVSPTKTTTIPRLELCSALLLARLYDSILDPLSSLNILSTRLHTDAKIVLGWLHTPPHLLKIFVANRVNKILALTTSDMWLHIPGESNPADIASRGSNPRNLVNHALWWHGPEFYQQDPVRWPEITSPEILNELPELRKEQLILTSLVYKPNFEEIAVRFSSYIRFTRVMSYVFRFVNSLKGIQPPESTTISVPELKTTELNCVRLIQNQFFADELKQIRSDKLKSNIFRSVSPFLDSNNVLRVGGRLRHSNLEYEARHPLLLPKNCQLSKLICDHYHQLSLHSGPRTTQSLIVQKFWIFSLRSLLRWRIHNCVRCLRFQSSTHQPTMADLPSVRLNAIRAFQSVGVDYAGPFEIKLNHTRNSRITKGYLAIFVCMATKAAHLELVSDLSSDAFLAAFDRFSSRRGLPSDVYSDNGTNFVGAKNQLDDLRKFLASSNNHFKNLLANRQIKWHFNPPTAPNFGGLWEAAVKSAKLLLKRTLLDQKLTFEELSTLFTRIEAILNSRPLFENSTEPGEELMMLTPGHFLIGQPLLQAPEPILSSTCTPQNRWMLLKQIIQSFWKHWSRNYLHTLTLRKKWNKSSVNLQEGQTVILTHYNTTPTQWPLGVIKKLHYSPDSKTRVATVHIVGGDIVRPVNRLILIPPLQ